MAVDDNYVCFCSISFKYRILSDALATFIENDFFRVLIFLSEGLVVKQRMEKLPEMLVISYFVLQLDQS